MIKCKSVGLFKQKNTILWDIKIVCAGTIKLLASISNEWKNAPLHFVSWQQNHNTKFKFA